MEKWKNGIAFGVSWQNSNFPIFQKNTLNITVVQLYSDMPD